MPQSRKRNNRSNNFKQKSIKMSKEQQAKQEAAKQQASAQQKRPKTMLVPQIQWESKEQLNLPGQYADAFQQTIHEAFISIQRIGQAFQSLLATNVKAGKAKLIYVWDNGDIPTEAELAAYQEQINKVEEQRKAQMESVDKAITNQSTESDPAEDNDGEGGEEQPTGLVTAGGKPLTEENLEKENKELIV